MRELRGASFEEVRVDWLRHEQETRPRWFSTYTEEERALMLRSPPIETPLMERWLLIRFGPRWPMMCPLEPVAKNWRLVEIEGGDYHEICPIYIPSWQELASPGGHISDVGRAYKRLRGRGVAGMGERARSILDEIREGALPAASESFVNGRFVMARGISGRITLLDGNHRAAAQCALADPPPSATETQEAWLADLVGQFGFAP